MLRFLSPRWSGRFRAPGWLPWLLTAGSVLALLPFFFIACFNHPAIVDDFENVRWTSFPARQWELYRHWSGRYFNNAAVSLNPLHWHSITGYRWAVIIIMTLFALAFAALVAFVLRRLSDAPRRTALAVAAASTVLLFNNFPSLPQGFFWLTGAATYALPAIAAFALLGLLLFLHGRERLRWSAWTAAALLAVIAIGGNEILLVLCDALVFAAWRHWKRQRQRQKTRFYFSLLILCGICSAIALLAPGNLERQAVNPRPLAMVPVNWLVYSTHACYAWIADPFLLLFSMCAGWLLAPFSFRVHRLSLLQAFLLPLLLVFLLTLPAVYGLGVAPTPRVMNLIYTFFLLAWLVFLLRLIRFLKELPLNPEQRNVARQAGIILLLLLALISVNTQDLRRSNCFAVTKSLIRRIPQSYDREMRARYAYIAAAKKDTVYLAPLRTKEGNPLFLVDVTDWPSNSNRFFAEYWGKKMVFADTTGRR